MTPRTKPDISVGMFFQLTHHKGTAITVRSSILAVDVVLILLALSSSANETGFT